MKKIGAIKMSSYTVNEAVIYLSEASNQDNKYSIFKF